MSINPTFRCGHPRTPENSVDNGDGYMRCRQCKAKQGHAYRAQQSKAMDDEPIGGQTSRSQDDAMRMCSQSLLKAIQRRHAGILHRLAENNPNVVLP